MNKKTIEKIIYFGDLYRREYLNNPEFNKYFLKRNWWNGLSLFLNHSFYQGRKDEVSKLVDGVNQYNTINNGVRSLFY